MNYIRKLQLNINNPESESNQRVRRIGWLVCLVLVVVLGVGGLRAGIEAIRQAMGVRGLLQAGASLATEEPNNPFVCLRTSGISAQAQAALRYINDEYLKGVGLCMAGEGETGKLALQGAGENSNAAVQNAAAISAKDPQAGADELARMGLSSYGLAAFMQKLIARPEIDPYPGLRLLAQQANDQPETWSAWLQGSYRLEAEKEWQAALDWIKEGLAIAPQTVRSSLYLQEGRIYQTQADPLDYQSALAAYNQAIEEGDWIYVGEQVTAHQYRGEVYQALKDEYGPNMALAEFQKAVDLQPDNYWVLLEMGHVYMYDLKNSDQAETYYRLALAADEKSPYAYYYIGEIYRERGDKGSAADWYHQALDQEPNWQPALDRLKELAENGGG
jgi:tetratricopeptide (TPR) repeat protein